jgi:hypothetical protein
MDTLRLLACERVGFSRRSAEGRTPGAKALEVQLCVARLKPCPSFKVVATGGRASGAKALIPVGFCGTTKVVP